MTGVMKKCTSGKIWQRIGDETGVCMLYIVTGGSGSGKSAFAEDLAVKLNKESFGHELYYIATMHTYDKESMLRVKRHRDMRKGKGFVTIEREMFLGDSLEEKKQSFPFETEKTGTYLLEDLSNLLANEMYMGNHKQCFLEEKESGETVGARLLCRLLKTISEKTANLVIVTNEIFSDGGDYDRETESFIMQLGYLNRQLAKEADGVVEVVCGIPLWQKGREKC